MSSPIDTINAEINTLKDEQEKLYQRFAEIDMLLKSKQVIVDAFTLVSQSPTLYDAWKSQVILTKRPDEPIPPPTPLPVVPTSTPNETVPPQ